MQRGGDGGKLQLAARDEEGQLLGRGFGLVGTRHDGGAQLVVGREHAVVQDGVGPRRWDQGTQPSEKGVGGHLGEGGPEATQLLEVHPSSPFLRLFGVLVRVPMHRGQYVLLIGVVLAVG